MTHSQEWDEMLATALIEERAALPGALLPILHALQDTFGYIDKRALPVIRDTLNLSRAEIVGVVDFYDDFHWEARGAHVLRVCRAEACQSMGGEALVAHLERVTGIATGQTNAARTLTLDSVYCLGNCALSPAVMLDGRLIGRVSPARAEALLQEAGV